jgi:hypothetical protein
MEQLIEVVVTKLADNLVENICMPDIGPDRALSGDVSRGPATEAGAGEHAYESDRHPSKRLPEGCAPGHVRTEPEHA